MGIKGSKMIVVNDSEKLNKEIWNLYLDGYFIWEIAKKLDLTESYVVKVLNIN